LFDFLIEDNAFTEVAVFGMSEPDVSLRSSNLGFGSIMIRQELRPKACLGKSIRIRAPTVHFHESCANMFARKRSSRLRMPFASFPRSQLSACV
jgi:hypothetical protein